MLAQRNPHLRLLPASTIKTLTALTLLPRLDPAAVYIATRADADMEGSRVGLVAGASYSIDDLFYGLFLRSGNDAASALANAAGGLPTAVAAMNETARRLGARDTLAVNPSGLDAPGQLTTAYDLALIGRAALTTPAIRTYTSTLRRSFPGKPAPPGRPRPTFEIQNKQRFVRQYPGAVGIKNGYTVHAHGTLIAAATRGERTVLVTLMHCGRSMVEEAAALTDWAFGYAGSVPPVGRLSDPLPTGPAAALPDPTDARTAPVGTGHRLALGRGAVGLGGPVGVLLALLALARAARRRRRKRRLRSAPLLSAGLAGAARPRR